VVGVPTKRLTAAVAVALVPIGIGWLTTGAARAQLSVPPPAIETYAGDPGRVGDPASWRTPEFLRDNGMLSIGAEF